MKKVILFLILISLSIIGCHTDIPTGIDTVKPSSEILMVSSEDSVFYDKTDTTFVDFTNMFLSEANYSIKVNAKDNDEVYKVSLFAIDSATSKKVLIKEVKNPSSNLVTITFSGRDFATISDNPSEKVYLVVDVRDAFDMIVTSTEKLGFYVAKQHPLEIFSSEFGKIMEVEGDSVDFADFTSKLTFVQFHGYMCGSCDEEAEEFKSFYENHSDHSKYTIELFGSESYGMTFSYVKEEIKEKYDLPFNCFFDENQNVKHFFKDFLDIEISNDIFAVFKSGAIVKYNPYDPNANFPEWIEEMYNKL